MCDARMSARGRSSHCRIPPGWRPTRRRKEDDSVLDEVVFHFPYLQTTVPVTEGVALSENHIQEGISGSEFKRRCKMKKEKQVCKREAKRLQKVVLCN